MGIAEENSIDAATAAVLSEYIKMALKAFLIGHLAPASLPTGFGKISVKHSGA